MWMKMMCKKKNGIQILARCDKLWEEKSRKSRQAGSEGDEPLAAEPDNENRCEAEKNEEILKFRQHQYQENPEMMIDGDDVGMVMDCDHCGPEVTECMLDDCDECGTSWVREDYVLCVLGNDVVSMVPKP